MSSPHRPSENELERRLAFETLLVDLSSRFIDLPPDEVDGELEDALRRVCAHLEIDYAVLWQWTGSAPGVLEPTHLYSNLEGLESADSLRSEQFPWYVDQMLAGRTVAISSLGEFPAEAAVDRESCRLAGIKSNLCFPLWAGGTQRLGALGLSTVRVERDWPEEVVGRLRLFAQIFANALARKTSDQALHVSQSRLANGVALAGLAFYEVDLDAGLMYIDDGLRALCGIPPERQEGLQALEFWMEHLHPADLPGVLHIRERLHTERRDAISVEYRYLHPERGETWIQHLAGARSRDASGQAIRTFGVLRDITERKRAETELRDLSQRLMRAHEEERALLARELHDDVTQRLAVLAIDAGLAERAAPGDVQAQTMRSIREGLVGLSEDIHSLAYQLHPAVLEELGLHRALQTECERLRRQDQVEISLELDPQPAAVGKDVELCLFRVTQEALKNVVRHAAAQGVTVTLRQAERGLLLTVRDDGVGFDPKRGGTGRSLGLVSMRERVRLVDGKLEVDSAPGEGTTIRVWVPATGESP